MKPSRTNIESSWSRNLKNSTGWQSKKTGSNSDYFYSSRTHQPPSQADFPNFNFSRQKEKSGITESSQLSDPELDTFPKHIAKIKEILGMRRDTPLKQEPAQLTTDLKWSNPDIKTFTIEKINKEFDAFLITDSYFKSKQIEKSRQNTPNLYCRRGSTSKGFLRPNNTQTPISAFHTSRRDSNFHPISPGSLPPNSENPERGKNRSPTPNAYFFSDAKNAKKRYSKGEVVWEDIFHYKTENLIKSTGDRSIEKFKGFRDKIVGHLERQLNKDGVSKYSASHMEGLEGDLSILDKSEDLAWKERFNPKRIKIASAVGVQGFLGKFGNGAQWSDEYQILGNPKKLKSK